MDPSTIITALTIGGALSTIATPVPAIALAASARGNRRLAERNAAQAVSIAGLTRRLEDVSAIRRAPPAHLAVVLDAAKLMRAMAERYATHEEYYLNAGEPLEGKAKEAEADVARHRAMAERLEVVLIQTDGGTVGVDDGSGRPVRTRPRDWTPAMGPRARHGSARDQFERESG